MPSRRSSADRFPRGSSWISDSPSGVGALERPPRRSHAAFLGAQTAEPAVLLGRAEPDRPHDLVLLVELEEPSERGRLDRDAASSGPDSSMAIHEPLLPEPRSSEGRRQHPTVPPIELPGPARDLLASDAVATIVTLDEDGGPQLTSAWVGLDGDEIVFATMPEQRKLRNLRRDRRTVEPSAPLSGYIGLTSWK